MTSSLIVYLALSLSPEMDTANPGNILLHERRRIAFAYASKSVAIATAMHYGLTLRLSNCECMHTTDIGT